MNDRAAAPLPTLKNGTRPDGVEYKTRGLEMRMESGHYGEHKQQHPHHHHHPQHTCDKDNMEGEQMTPQPCLSLPSFLINIVHVVRFCLIMHDRYQQ